jgi:hypothetical protein
MAHNIRIDAERGVVRVAITGAFETESMPRIAAAAREVAAANGFPLLYDVRGATPGDVRRQDVFWLPRTVPALRATGAGRLRVAMVYTGEDCPIVQFWETVCRNVGLQVRAFTDEALALAWLAP